VSWLHERPSGLLLVDRERSFGGYTLFASVRGDQAVLLDPDGTEVHRWTHPEGIQYASLLANGRLLLRTLPPEDAGGAERIGGSSGAIVELDRSSKEVWRYEHPLLHHDFERRANGNTLALLWATLPEDVNRSVRGAHEHEDDPERMWGDLVREIAPDGSTVDEWRSWEHLSYEDDVICPLESRKEWTHANSLREMPDGDWLVSFRLISTVAMVERATGAFRWKWGPGVLSHQHDASLLDSGNVLIFDNGAHRKRGPGFSQIVEVDPTTDEIVWSFKAETILDFFSFMVSAAQRLPNGNTFITNGAFGHLFEITPEGEIVWSYLSPHFFESPFGSTPAIFRAHRYAADDPRCAP
jgi:outer membrane protein assembly factor BamB